jgi:protein CWC15
MTTAHRPTWKAAVGRAQEGGWSAGGALSSSISALDAPAHRTLKTRSNDDNVHDKEERLRQSLLALQQAEAAATKPLHHRPIDPAEEERSKQKLLLLKSQSSATTEIDREKLKEKYDDSDIDDGDDDNEKNDTNHDNGHSSDSDLDNDSDLDDSDDEDDEAALQAELAKIRAEREAVKQKAEAVAAARDNAQQEEAALLGNPLLLSTTTGNAVPSKRRWNDDVVFRNQAKGEPQPKKRFINDTVRNDFHRRFLNKFIR